MYKRELGSAKKRKIVGTSKRKTPVDAASVIPKQITAGHYTKSINDTLDIMGAFPHTKDFHIVMDNSPHS